MSDFYKLFNENDILWNHFTRREEYNSVDLDKHQRFKSSNSEYKNLLEPTVSQHLVKNGLSIDYPDKKEFAICLTHDVDDVIPPFSHMAASTIHLLKKRNFKDGLDYLFWKMKNKSQSPYKNFNNIMNLENKYGAKSTFFFLTTKEDIKRPRYEIDEVVNQLGEIIDNGWEVGLHISYHGYNDLQQIQSEKRLLEKTINRTIMGCRNHYLRFQVPESWELLSKAKFKYDTTLGYSDTIGFRNGMCHPFKPYNLKTNSDVQIVEIPMAIMDTTLFETHQSVEDAIRSAQNMIDIVSKCHGVLVVNWHSYVFNSPFREYWLKVYEKILDYGKQKNAWLTNGKEIFNRSNCVMN